MSRGKIKFTEGSIEDRLEQALVPDWEQPYKVPLNWCWTTLAHVAQWGSGGTPSRISTHYYSGSIPWVKTGELQDDYIYKTEENLTEEALLNSSAKLFPVNTVIIAMYGATIGKTGILGIKSTTNQACACAICTNAVLHKYLFYFARSAKEAFIKKAKGGAQPNISQEIIKAHEIPLPPLAEQQRIVDRIESLFTKLDEAKEKLQEVVDGFETRKSAILHKAFTGELTTQWREEHGIVLESWKTFIFDDCVEKMQNGLAKRSGNKGNPFVVLRLANLTEDGFSTEDLRQILLDRNEQESYSLRKNDVVMIRVNGSKDNVGRQLIIEEDANWAFCDHLIRIRYKEDVVLPLFMVYFSKSSDYSLYIKDNMVSSAGQNTISRKGLIDLQVPVPSIEEQKEVLNIIQNTFANEQQVKETSEEVLEKIDLIKKSILARAFRGELGTNDPCEESAIELLRSILSTTPEKEAEKIRRLAVSIPNEILKELSNELQKEIVRLYFKKDVKTLAMDDIMAVSSKKFDLLESLRVLEQKGLVKRQNNGNYTLLR